MSMTALQSLQLLDRMYAFEAIDSPSIYNDEMMWTGTALSIAGVPLLVGEGQIAAVLETPPVAPIPGTGPWVLGIAAHNGGLLPVFDGDRLFREQGHTGRAREYCLIVDKPGNYFAITLSGVFGNRTYPLKTLKQDEAIDSAFADYCLGGFADKDQFFAILDIDKLVTQSTLFNAAMSETVANEESQHDHVQDSIA